MKTYIYRERDIQIRARDRQTDGERGREMNEVIYPPTMGTGRFGLLIHRCLCRPVKTNYILQ